MFEQTDVRIQNVEPYRNMVFLGVKIQNVKYDETKRKIKFYQLL